MTDHPTIGSRLGAYEITGKLGEGGMGEVYRATDGKLRREVAIKVLPGGFTENPERLARFEREAQLLAQLHHPNIASIFGLEEAEGVRALILELVEGPTLAERLESGSMPLEETLEIGRQIAEALEEAHEKGIIHRDLKPQNIKASADGKVKVLDFGLAKAMDPAEASTSVADLAQSPTLLNSPTLTAVHGTQLGVILGTAAYMAPEQARGSAVDKRADIWAFGVVLYEMLVGSSLFAADTVTDTLAGVLKTEIDFARLPAETPAAIRQLLGRCLERNPKKRLRDMGEARIALERLLEQGPPWGASVPATDSDTRAPHSSPRRALLPWAIAGVMALTAVGISLRSPEPAEIEDRPLTAFGVLAPERTFFPRAQTPPIELSADGRTLLFATESEQGSSIYRRSFDRMEVTRVDGTDGAMNPVLSDDGRTIAFFADGRLQKIPIEGGRPIDLAEARAPRGVAWAPDGSLIFSPVFNSGLWRVAATGGAPVEVSQLDASKGERTHRWPQVLPGGRTVIFTVGLLTNPSNYDDATIEALDFDTGERRTILEGARMARYTAAGYLVFQRRETLLAVRFDPIRLERSGEPFVIQEGVGGDTGGGIGFFAVASTGALAYLPESAIESKRVLVIADLEGVESEIPIPPASFWAPRFSPSGDRLAYSVGGGGLADDDVFVAELATHRVQRLTFQEGRAFPFWSPDGKRLVYTLDRIGRLGGQNLGMKAADGSGEEIEVASAGGFLIVDAWLPDGRLVVSDVEQTLDIRLLDPETDEMTPLFASSTAAEYGSALSPDGRFIAYTSNDSSMDEVFVESFPPGNGKWQVSTDGGACPRWARDGSELFFFSGTKLMAAEIHPGTTFRSGIPRLLFDGAYDACTPPTSNYDVSPDGHFVLIKRRVLSEIRHEIVVLDGWQAGDKARAEVR